MNSDDLAYGVRVVHGGAWGFASGFELTPEAAAGVVDKAVAMAEMLGPLNREPVELAPEPVHHGSYVSPCRIDPFTVADDDKVGFLLAINDRVLGSSVDHVEFGVLQVLEDKYFANLEGSVTTQQRVRVEGNFEAVKLDERTGGFETMRSCAAPTGRGWEHLSAGYDYAREA